MIPSRLNKIDALFGEGMEESLGIKGAQSSPQEVNLSHVQPTIDVGAGGFVYHNIQQAVLSNTSIAAIASTQRPMFGPTGYASGANAVLKPTSRDNARVIAAYSKITFDAAGALAFNGKKILVQYLLRNIATAASDVPFMEFHTVATGTLNYYSFMNAAFWKGWVPYTYAFDLYIGSDDTTVFPANTTLTLRSCAAFRKATAQLPQ